MSYFISVKELARKYAYWKDGAEQRGWSFTLAESKVKSLLRNKCEYCGGHEKMGIDRVINSIGYNDNNVVSCCAKCNMMKGRLDVLDFIEQCRLVAKHHGPKYHGTR